MYLVRPAGNFKIKQTDWIVMTNSSPLKIDHFSNIPIKREGNASIYLRGVATLCIAIVWLPLFELGGVAGYLFKPMAEAVIIAMLASFILSRTLVPTMAKYMMKDHHVAAA